VPSDRGYRFYVDRLMDPIPPAEELHDRASVLRRFVNEEMDEILRQTCRLLSGLTQYASVATTPELDAAAVGQVHLTSLDRRRVLVVLIPSTGEVKHRILETPHPVAPTRLSEVGARVGLLLAGKTGEQLRRFAPAAPDDLPEGTASLFNRVVQALRDMMEPKAEGEVVVEGANQMLRQPEFQNLERLEGLLSALEERQELMAALRDSTHVSVTSIRIGGENQQQGMQECSVVASRYWMGPGAHGSIGVIGPTRMDYGRAIAAVRTMADCLSELFGYLGEGAEPQ
jgi:heat-inducible transcriptional repressor